MTRQELNARRGAPQCAPNNIAAIAVLLLVACTPIAGQQQPTAALAAKATVSATSIATLDLSLGKATPMHSMDLGKETCLAAGGMVEAFSLPSELLDHDLRLRVYTPPCYEEHTDATYPVLYFIHGQTYTEDQWDRLGADEAADALIANGEVTPFIIVMPADESHYTQPSANKFDEAVVEELIPWVDESYRTLADRESRAVGGLSRGASWAFHLAFTRPELFGAVGGHSPPVFQEDAPRMRMLLDELPTGLRPRIWLDIGERDQRAILESATWLEGLLDERDIPHHWTLNPGDHSEDYWRSHVELYLRWYAQEW